MTIKIKKLIFVTHVKLLLIKTLFKVFGFMDTKMLK